LFLCVLIAAVVCGSCQCKWQSNARWRQRCWHQRLLFSRDRWCHVISTCQWWGWEIKSGAAGLLLLFIFNYTVTLLLTW